MAGEIKKEKQSQELKSTDTVVNFDNVKDYVAITLKSDGQVYVEHKLFAKRLVDKKLAEYAKDVQLEEVKPNTQVLD